MRRRSERRSGQRGRSARVPGARHDTAVALILGLTLSACTGPPSRPDGVEPAVIAARAACGPAQSLLSERRYSEALVELRVAEAAGGASSTHYPVCVARAQIGLNTPSDALQTLAALRTHAAEPSRSEAVRRSSCLYEAWAQLRLTPDWRVVADQLDDCQGLYGVRATAGDALLPEDAGGAALLLVAARAAGDLTGAVAPAEALLFGETLDDRSKSWLVQHLLARAEGTPDSELPRLSQASATLGPALAGYAQLMRATESGSTEVVQALLPDVRARLLALGAEPQARALDGLLAAEEPARAPLFGAVLALSGPGRQVGRAQLAGLLLAEAVFGEADGTVADDSSRLVIIDAGTTAASAVAAVDQLDAAGVLAIIGPFEAHQAAAAMAEAERRGIPYVSLSDEVDPPPGARFSARLFPAPEAEAEALVELARAEGLWRVAVAAPDPAPAYLARLLEAFLVGAAAAGIRITEVERYRVSDLQAEAARVANQLARSDFDALLIVDAGANATTLGAYLGTHDVWARAPGRLEAGSRRYVTYLGTSFWHDPEFLSTGPDYLEGGLFTAWLPGELGYEATRRFIERFVAAYGRRPGLLGAYAHDALALLRFLVIESGLRTRTALADAIGTADLVGSATGELRFGPGRVSQQHPFVLRVTASGFEPR